MPGTQSRPRDRNENTRPGTVDLRRQTKSLKEGARSALRKKAPNAWGQGTGLPDTLGEKVQKGFLKETTFKLKHYTALNRLGTEFDVSPY